MNDIKIPQALLKALAKINTHDVLAHAGSEEELHAWLCSWQEEIKKELFDFANNKVKRQQIRAEAITEPVRALHNDYGTSDGSFMWKCDEARQVAENIKK